MKRKGFSLIELLVVLAVIGILTALTLPAISSTNQAMQMSRATQMLGSALDLARMTALSRNMMVRVGFYRNTSTDQCDAFRIDLVTDTGEMEPLQRMQNLPQGVGFSDNQAFSTLLRPQTEPPPTENIGGRELQKCGEFRFLPDGGTNLDPGQNWYVTLILETEIKQPMPKNYATFLIEPNSGIARVFRP